MKKETIIEQIRNDKKFLEEKFGVEQIALFGSYANNTQTEDSDIDFFVSFKKPSYSAIIGLYKYLENKLNAKVDVVRKGPHLSQRFLNTIHKNIYYV